MGAIAKVGLPSRLFPLLPQATFEEPLFFLEDVFVTGLLARRCREQVAMIPDKEGRFELAPKDEEERAAKVRITRGQEGALTVPVL